MYTLPKVPALELGNISLLFYEDLVQHPSWEFSSIVRGFFFFNSFFLLLSFPLTVGFLPASLEVKRPNFDLIQVTSDFCPTLMFIYPN